MSIRSLNFATTRQTNKVGEEKGTEAAAAVNELGFSRMKRKKL